MLLAVVAVWFLSTSSLNRCEKQAGMFALRERRQHVTQEDFEMAVSKVMKTLGDRESFSMRQLSFQIHTSSQGKIRTRI